MLQNTWFWGDTKKTCSKLWTAYKVELIKNRLCIPIKVSLYMYIQRGTCLKKAINNLCLGHNHKLWAVCGLGGLICPIHAVFEVLLYIYRPTTVTMLLYVVYWHHHRHGLHNKSVRCVLLPKHRLFSHYTTTNDLLWSHNQRCFHNPSQ